MMDEVITQLIGEELSGVLFTRDYVQLQFDPPPLLNAISPMTVTAAGLSFRQGERDFANALIAQIGKRVAAVGLRHGDALQLRFGDGSMIAVSLRKEDLRSPEAAAVQGLDGRWTIYGEDAGIPAQPKHDELDDGGPG